MPLPNLPKRLKLSLFEGSGPSIEKLTESHPITGMVRLYGGQKKLSFAAESGWHIQVKKFPLNGGHMCIFDP